MKIAFRNAVVLAVSLFLGACCFDKISLKPVVGYTPPATTGNSESTGGSGSANAAAPKSTSAPASKSKSSDENGTITFSIETTFEFRDCQEPLRDALKRLLSTRGEYVAKYEKKTLDGKAMMELIKPIDEQIAGVIARLGTPEAQQKAEKVLPAPKSNSPAANTVALLNKSVGLNLLTASVIKFDFSAGKKTYSKPSAKREQQLLKSQIEMTIGATRARAASMGL